MDGVTARQYLRLLDGVEAYCAVRLIEGRSHVVKFRTLDDIVVCRRGVVVTEVDPRLDTTTAPTPRLGCTLARTVILAGVVITIAFVLMAVCTHLDGATTLITALCMSETTHVYTK